MAFNVNEILGAVNSVGGLSKSSKFLVNISSPFNPNSRISFYCDSASLPGIGWQTDEIKPSGYGIVQKRPIGVIFQDVNLSFFNDAEGRVLKYFHTWMQSIFNFNQQTNPNATAQGLSYNTFQYPSDYYGTVEIVHFDDTGSDIVTYTLNEAYPIIVGDVQLDWGATDHLVKLPITFTYTSWTADTLDEGTMDDITDSLENTIMNQQYGINNEVAFIRELLNVTSPVIIRNRTNQLAALLSFI